MVLNPLIVALSALVPTIVGFIYYNPKVLGNAWEQAAGLSPDRPKPNMAVTMLISLVLGFLASVSMTMIVVHSNGLFSMLANVSEMEDATSELSKNVADLVTKYGNDFRTFKHGAFHGVLTAIFLVLPVIATSAMWEGRSWKYISISAGYWLICLALMGGILCQFS
jgi:Protein of unknown function (DUF1761)